MLAVAKLMSTSTVNSSQITVQAVEVWDTFKTSSFVVKRDVPDILGT